jgi:hydroxymethylglutaryl-CoA lyase
MSSLPKRVQINEEGPREGFQFEKGPIPTARKIALIDALSQTGLKQIQTVSFVPAKIVPGMADADEVVDGFTPAPGVTYTGLWMNEQGLQRALTKKKLSCRGMLALTASKTFLAKNQRRTFEENFQAQRALAAMYRENQVPLEYIGLMAAFGCNFEGDIAVATVLDLIGQMDDILVEFNSDARTLVLADTMAWATPQAITRVVAAVQDRFPKYRIGLHLHDTRGMGIANAYAGLQMGVDLFDAAVAGLGGCPFAAHRGAAGNVCTEDLVFMCEEMGIETGIDLDRLIESALLAEDVVGHPLPGSVMKGGSLRQLRARLAAAS